MKIKVSTAVIAVSWFILVFVTTIGSCRRTDGVRVVKMQTHNSVWSVSAPLPALLVHPEPVAAIGMLSAAAPVNEVDPVEALRLILPNELKAFAEVIRAFYRVKHETIAAEQNASHEVLIVPRTDEDRDRATDLAGILLEAEDDKYDIALKELKEALGDDGYRRFEVFDVTCDPVLNAMFRSVGLGSAEVKVFAEMAKSEMSMAEKFDYAKRMLGEHWSKFGGHVSLHLR